MTKIPKNIEELVAREASRYENYGTYITGANFMYQKMMEHKIELANKCQEQCEELETEILKSADYLTSIRGYIADKEMSDTNVSVVNSLGIAIRDLVGALAKYRKGESEEVKDKTSDGQT